MSKALAVRQILLSLGAGDRASRGNIWRVTSKKTDFYLDPLSEHDAMHLTVHGPNEKFSDHRFHLRINKKAVQEARATGQFVAHGIPRKGLAFTGVKVARNAYRVARIRWVWDLQRDRFRDVAVTGAEPVLLDHQSGHLMSSPMQPNSAWDVDFVVSYGAPFWPDQRGSLRDNARLGPLRNDADMYLTATSYHRSQLKYPTPADLVLPVPGPLNQPNRIMCGGLGPRGADDMYWFVERITTRKIIEVTLAAQK